MIIHPKYQPGVAEKVVRSLRIWLQEGIKPTGVPYWDVTSQTLVAQLEPIMKRDDLRRLTIRIDAYGIAPRKRFTVTIVPR